jgi:hypothetical protein
MEKINKSEKKLLKKVEKATEQVFKEDKFEEDEITLCAKCMCMTKSIRKSRALWICGKCKADKTLGDVFQYEAKQEMRTR